MRAPFVLAVVTAFVVLACSFFPEVGELRQDGAPSPGTSGGDVGGGTSGGDGTSSSSGGTSGGASSGVPGDGGASSGGTSSGDPVDGGDDATGPRTWIVVVGPGDSDRFDPRNLKIKAGDTVRWFWAYGGHNVISDDGLFCSPNDTNCGNAPEQPKGSIYERTFPGPGVFKYHCGSHKDDGMSGTITVE
jgi:plastocyanin